MARSGEHTPPACGFRCRAENFVPQIFFTQERPGIVCDKSSGATPKLARGTRALLIPVSDFGLKI
jgi:hypothetical protein